MLQQGKLIISWIQWIFDTIEYTCTLNDSNVINNDFLFGVRSQSSGLVSMILTYIVGANAL